MTLSTTHIRDQFLVRDKEGKVFVMSKGKLVSLQEAVKQGIDGAVVQKDTVRQEKAQPAPPTQQRPQSQQQTTVLKVRSKPTTPPPTQKEKDAAAFAPLTSEKSDMAKELEDEIRKGLLAKKEEKKEEPKKAPSGQAGAPLSEVVDQAPQQEQPEVSPGQGGAAKTEGARFYFSPDDEEEVDKFRKNISGAVHMASFLDEVALEVIRQSKVHLGDDIQGRLQRIIASRLRSIRDLVETRAVLSRGVPSGGIGLEDAQVNAIIDLTESYRKRIEDGSLKKEIEAAQKKEEESQKQEKAAQIQMQQKIAQKEATRNNQKNETTTGERKAIPKISRPSKKVGGLSDVQAPTQLIGPIEELKGMTLQEWRNYGTDLVVRMQKILEKIDLVAEDSYEDRAKAIEAWKASPLYAMYVMIGHKSMEQEGGVEQVISQIKKEQGQALTVEEFDAIVDFNQSIQF